MSNDYEFRTVWRVAGTIDEVVTVLADGASFGRWWPSVYLAVTPVRSADADGAGAVLDLFTKGWLPYTLSWRLRYDEAPSANGFRFSASGDFNGGGRWTFEQDGPEVVISCDWRISADKPLLRRLSWLFRPVFEANHRWAMARGEESLALELRRRRAGDPAAATSRTVPPPPGPTFRWWVALRRRVKLRR